MPIGTLITSSGRCVGFNPIKLLPETRTRVGTGGGALLLDSEDDVDVNFWVLALLTFFGLVFPVLLITEL